MKGFLLSVAVGCAVLIGSGSAQAQQFYGNGGYGPGNRHGHVQTWPNYPGARSYGGIGASYYGGNVYGGGYSRPSHVDYVPGHFDFGRGYVPSHTDVHLGGRRYEVLPGGYIAPNHHHRD